MFRFISAIKKIHMSRYSVVVRALFNVTLFIVGSILFMKCTSHESDSILDPNQDSILPDADVMLESSDYYELYNHSNNITEFAYSNGNIAIADETGLTLVIGDAKYFYSEINYEISGDLFTAQMQNITGLEYNRDGLYIATDEHFVLYDDDDEKFYGQPIRVHLIKKLDNKDKIQGLWEWYLTDDLVGIYLSEMEMDEEEFLVDGGPCLDFF